MKLIIDIELEKVYERLGERGLNLILTDESKELIIDKGASDIDYGARPLRRCIETFIEDPLSEELLRDAFEGKNTITVRVKEVGDTKQLDFDATFEESAEPEMAAVGSEDENSGESEES